MGYNNIMIYVKGFSRLLRPNTNLYKVLRPISLGKCLGLKMSLVYKKCRSTMVSNKCGANNSILESKRIFRTCPKSYYMKSIMKTVRVL